MREGFIDAPVEQAVQLADLFLDAGLVVETVGARTREVRMAQAGVKFGGPLVVLVDGKVVAAMVVMNPLTDVVPITGLFTEAEGQRIVKGIK